MKVELTVNGNLLQGKLSMSNAQRHEWETAKDSARRVRAWVRRYVAEMGYSAPSEDSAIDTACNAVFGAFPAIRRYYPLKPFPHGRVAVGLVKTTKQ